MAAIIMIIGVLFIVFVFVRAYQSKDITGNKNSAPIENTKNDYISENAEPILQEPEVVDNSPEINTSAATKRNNAKKVLQEVISFKMGNIYWWAGMLLTSLTIILGVVGYFFVRNANEEDKSAYISGMWKGLLIISIIKAMK